MLIVRAAKESDIDQLYDLIQKSAYGLTTLKISKEQLLERIEASTFAFQMKTGKPAGQPYVFVMEDLAYGKVVGTCAIYSKTGGFEPFYYYRQVYSALHHLFFSQRFLNESSWKHLVFGLKYIFIYIYMHIFNIVESLGEIYT